MDLMAAEIPEFKKEFWINLHAALGSSIELDHPALNSFGRELRVPWCIERVCEINSTSIAAHLHHLRAAVQGRGPILRMSGAAHDTTQMHGTRLLWMKGVGHVVLQKFPGSPAGNIKEAVVERQIDIRDKWEYGLESLKQRRQLFRIGGLGGNFDHFLHATFAVLAMPNPNGSGQIFQRYHYAKESIRAARIVGRAKLERHLVLGAQIQCLKVTTLAQIPDMQGVAVAPLQKNFWVHAVFHHVRRSPLAGNHGVKPQMPPEVVGKELRPTVDFPFPQNLKAVRIHDENSTRPLSRSGAQRAAENSVRTAMHRVRPAVARTFSKDVGFNHLDDFRTSRLGLRIDDMDSRRLDAWHDQVAPLGMRMWHVRAEASAASVPTEMVQFVAGVGHVHAAHKTAVGRGRRVHIHDTQRVGTPITFWVEHGHKC